MNERYARFKAMGVCRRCGNKPMDGMTRCRQCNDDHLAYGQAYKKRLKRRGLCASCGKLDRSQGHAYCDSCIPEIYQKNRERTAKYRADVIFGYGGKCACCGIDVAKYLQLDHINGGGRKHTRDIKKNGNAFYGWAIRNHFPSYLQLLCASCHQAKTIGSPCTQEDHRSMIRCGLPTR